MKISNIKKHLNSYLINTKGKNSHKVQRPIGRSSKFATTPILLAHNFGINLNTAHKIPKSTVAIHRQRISNSKRATGNTEYDAFHDQLTGLRNKEYLICRMPQYLEDAKKTNQTIKVSMFDMDNFKSINEFLGYEAGDFFLETISKHIKDVANKRGIAAYRFGGEEFVVVLKNMDKKESQEFGEEVLHRVEKDEDLLSYIDAYKTNAQEKINALADKDNIYRTIKRSIHKNENFSEIVDEYNRFLIGPHSFSDDDFSRFSKQKKEENINELLNAYNCALEKIKSMPEYAENPELKKVESLIKLARRYNKIGFKLNKTIEKIGSNEFFSNVLEKEFDKKYELIQYKVWLKNIVNKGAFTLTNGIKCLKSEDLDKDPVKIVDMAGEILKRGKNTSKGKVYYE